MSQQRSRSPSKGFAFNFDADQMFYISEMVARLRHDIKMLIPPTIMKGYDQIIGFQRIVYTDPNTGYLKAYDVPEDLNEHKVAAFMETQMTPTHYHGLMRTDNLTIAPRYIVRGKCIEGGVRPFYDAN